jgi:hypothetical protein
MLRSEVKAAESMLDYILAYYDSSASGLVTSICTFNRQWQVVTKVALHPAPEASVHCRCRSVQTLAPSASTALALLVAGAWCRCNCCRCVSTARHRAVCLHIVQVLGVLVTPNDAGIARMALLPTNMMPIDWSLTDKADCCSVMQPGQTTTTTVTAPICSCTRAQQREHSC